MTKYNSKKVVYDWYIFDSTIESKYYSEFKDHIKKVHPRYELQSKYEIRWQKIRSIEYEWDFLLEIDWNKYVVDIKWMATSEAKLKRKMFMYKYPEIQLLWFVWCKKRWWRIDYFKNEKLKKEEKKYLLCK